MIDKSLVDFPDDETQEYRPRDLEIFVGPQCPYPAYVGPGEWGYSEQEGVRSVTAQEGQVVAMVSPLPVDPSEHVLWARGTPDKVVETLEQEQNLLRAREVRTLVAATKAEHDWAARHRVAQKSSEALLEQVLAELEVIRRQVDSPMWGTQTLLGRTRILIDAALRKLYEERDAEDQALVA